jgi:hypothetical protein
MQIIVAKKPPESSALTFELICSFYHDGLQAVRRALAVPDVVEEALDLQPSPSVPTHLSIRVSRQLFSENDWKWVPMPYSL